MTTHCLGLLYSILFLYLHTVLLMYNRVNKTRTAVRHAGRQLEQRSNNCLAGWGAAGTAADVLRVANIPSIETAANSDQDMNIFQ